MTIEENLIKKTIEGDFDASKELFSKLYDILISYFFKRGLNKFDSEDAAQEVLVKLVKHLNGYMEKGKFMIFVFSIARNVFIDFLRNKKKNSDILTKKIENYETDNRNLIENMEFLEMIKHLGSENQEIMILRYFYGFTIREISMIMDMPIRTVQSRIRLLTHKIKERNENE